MLHVFVADPLLEITKKPSQSGAAYLAEQRVQVARETINEVEKKLTLGARKKSPFFEAIYKG